MSLKITLILALIIGSTICTAEPISLRRKYNVEKHAVNDDRSSFSVGYARAEYVMKHDPLGKEDGFHTMDYKSNFTADGFAIRYGREYAISRRVSTTFKVEGEMYQGKISNVFLDQDHDGLLYAVKIENEELSMYQAGVGQSINFNYTFFGMVAQTFIEGKIGYGFAKSKAQFTVDVRSDPTINYQANEENSKDKYMYTKGVIGVNFIGNNNLFSYITGGLTHYQRLSRESKVTKKGSFASDINRSKSDQYNYNAGIGIGFKF